MKEKLKRLKKQLAEATGAEMVQINAVDMDFLLTAALAAAEDAGIAATMQRFSDAMERAAKQNQAQRIGLDRIIRRMDTARTYVGSIDETGLSRENLIKLSTAKKALNGDFDQ